MKKLLLLILGNEIKVFRQIILAIVLCTAILSGNPAAGQIISTVAGNGTGTFGGDGGPATAAGGVGSGAMTFDNLGNLYVQSGNRIRKINTSGIITTVAGIGGIVGYSGDGGPATLAQLDGAGGIAVDAAGNIYISGPNTHRVRKINTAGIISTVAGTGTAGNYGDGGPANIAQLNTPGMLALDGTGNLYICDCSNFKVRKIDLSGNISTFAGIGIPGFSGDGGPATAAQIKQPAGISVDATGSVYIADALNRRIRKVDLMGTITTVAGNGVAAYGGDGGTALAASFMEPVAIALDGSGNMYVCDYDDNRIRKIDAGGIVSTVAGTGVSGYNGDGCHATAATLYWPVDVKTDTAGNVYIADGHNLRLRKISENHLPAFAGSGSQTLSVCQSESPAAMPINTLLTVTDSDAGQTETWSVATAPAHGTLAAAYACTVMSGSVTPVGLTYTPMSGYTGSDSFRVKVTDCGNGVAYTEVHVTVNPLPQAGVINGPDKVCAGDSITLTATGMAGTWSHSGSHASVSGTGNVAGITAGTDTIRYRVTNACGTATAQKVISITDCSHVGVAGVSQVGEMVTIQPNPGSGTFTIHFAAATNEEVAVTVTDVQGRTIITQHTTTAAPLQLQLDSPAGLYYVTVSNAAIHWTGKLIVE